MNSNVRKLLFMIPLPILSISFCLEAKRSPFDVSSKSPTSSAILSRAFSGTTATATSSTSTATTSPTSTYTGTKTFTSLVPGESFSFDPKFTGQITSITISPAASTLPPGISFDPTTGIVSGTPIAQNAAYPLTTFTITATGPNGTVPVTFDISVLGSGDNVWTKLVAGSGGHTYGTYGGLNHDSGYLYVSGTSSASSIDSISNLESAGYNSGLITKYSTSGTKAWTVLFGTDTPANININVSANYLDSSGNIYVSGVVWPSGATGTFHSNSIPNQRTLFVTKYNSSGTRLWTSVKNTVPCTGGYLTVDSSGNSYITGTVLAGGLDSFVNSAWTDDGLPLVKFDSNGNWVATGGASAGSSTNGNLAGRGVATDASGNIYVLAQANKNAPCGFGGANYGASLLKFNSSLVYQTCTALGNAAYQTYALGLSKDSSGNFYATGYTAGNLGGQTKTGALDMFIVQYNSSMSIAWVRLLGVSGANTYGNWVTVDSQNNVYVTGNTNGNLDGQTKSGAQDMFIAKYDTSGNRIWTKLLGSSGSTADGQGVTFDSNSTMYVSGSINGSIGSETNSYAPNNALMITRFVK